MIARVESLSNNFLSFLVHALYVYSEPKKYKKSNEISQHIYHFKLSISKNRVDISLKVKEMTKNLFKR